MHIHKGRYICCDYETTYPMIHLLDIHGYLYMSSSLLWHRSHSMRRLFIDVTTVAFDWQLYEWDCLHVPTAVCMFTCVNSCVYVYMCQQLCVFFSTCHNSCRQFRAINTNCEQLPALCLKLFTNITTAAVISSIQLETVYKHHNSCRHFQHSAWNCLQTSQQLSSFPAFCLKLFTNITTAAVISSIVLESVYKHHNSCCHFQHSAWKCLQTSQRLLSFPGFCLKLWQQLCKRPPLCLYVPCIAGYADSHLWPLTGGAAVTYPPCRPFCVWLTFPSQTPASVARAGRK